MNKNKKPLFSKPVLAGIMIFSTLAIWALNATAPKSPTYAKIDIQSWQTDSGIPVIWLTQQAWQKTNTLKIRFSFQGPTQNLALTDATLSMMLDDPLPLISSTINQRLTPLTATVGSYYDHEGQILDISANNALQYLDPTMDLIDQWLTQPRFKVRSFDRWQRQPDPDLPALLSMQEALFTPKLQVTQTDDTDQSTVKKNIAPTNYAQQQDNLTLEQVAAYYQQLTQRVSRITLVGNMDSSTLEKIKADLNRITQHFAHATPVPNTTSIRSNKATLSNNASHQAAPSKKPLENQKPLAKGQTQQGVALAPIRSVQDWISLQMWGTDLVSRLKQQDNIAYIRLNLILSPTHPWAWWRIQYASPNALSSHTDAPHNNHNNKADNLPMLTAKDAIEIHKLTSITDKQRFDRLFDAFKKQLTTRTQSPEWWSKLATEVTQPNGQLSPSQFASHYQEAIDTFTQEDYQKALQYLLITTSYQESQVHP